MSNKGLLICTQTVDQSDQVLGFFTEWIREFAQQYEQVTVICLSKGDYSLPGNVSVYSLGKEQKKSRLRYLFKLIKYAWISRKRYSHVFVHMNPIYVVLIGAWWRIWGKKIGLWYAHKSVTWDLRLAVRLAHYIYTASAESFRLTSHKIKVVGHGIDTEKFSWSDRAGVSGALELITVGRISPIKDYETLIRSAERLQPRLGAGYHCRIVGAPATAAQGRYLTSLQELIGSRGLTSHFLFEGAVAHDRIVPFLHRADIFVSMSQTGSLDKALLEAMATGLPVITCNESGRTALGRWASLLYFPPGDDQACAERIAYLAAIGPAGRKEIGENLRNVVVSQHNLKGLIVRINKWYESSL